MDSRLVDLRSAKNRSARIKVMQGHFATSNSHLNTYVDMSTIKSRHHNAHETAKVLAQEYMTNTSVNTIVCLDGTEVIGSFIAEQLSDGSSMSLSHGNNISVVTPEIDTLGQMMFRDNKQRMITHQQVLLLTDSITTGTTLMQAIDAILYYGGTVCGIAAIFSAVTKIAGMEVKTIFTSSDLPNYRAYKRADCPMCAAGQRLEALVNGYGYSKLDN